MRKIHDPQYNRNVITTEMSMYYCNKTRSSSRRKTEMRHFGLQTSKTEVSNLRLPIKLPPWERQKSRYFQCMIYPTLMLDREKTYNNLMLVTGLQYLIQSKRTVICVLEKRSHPFAKVTRKQEKNSCTQSQNLILNIEMNSQRTVFLISTPEELRL